jgi:hypothetical protein
MPFRPLDIPRWTRGAQLTGEPDSIPDDSLRHAANVRLDRVLGAITGRPGWTRRTSGSLGAAVVAISRLVTTAATYSYAQLGSMVYRLTAAWGSPTSLGTAGTPIVSDANMPDGYGTLYKYLVTGGLAVKDNGSAVSTMGIQAPSAPPVGAALAADLTTLINAMENAAQWTGSSLGSGPANDTTYFIQGTQSVTGSVNASNFGTITQYAPTLNLDTLTGGDALVRQDDYIHLWVNIDRPERLTYLQIDIDVDSATTGVADAFRKNYYHVRIGPTSINQGIATWNQLQIRKSQFARFGSDTARHWQHAVAWRIGFLANSIGAVRFSVDDFKLRGGVGIEGNIQYTVCYRNSSTMGRGNPPLDASEVVQYTTPIYTNRQRISLDISNVLQGGAAHPGDSQIDWIMIWRKGGIFTEPVLVTQILDTAASPWVDATSDATLLLRPQVLETDNDAPPTGATRVVFGPGGSGHLFMLVDGYRLYFSKGYERLENRAENWGRYNFAIIGDRSSRAVAGIATATQIRVWTTDKTYNVVGVGEDTFLPVPIDGSRGAVGQHAVASGDGVLYFVSQDGIYADLGGRQVKLTSAIDPFFQGLTVDGQAGWSTDPDIMALVRLAFLNEPTGSAVMMLYVEGTGSTLNAFLVLKPNLGNAQLTECFFGYSNLANLSALLADPEARELLAGADDGNIYRVEDPVAYSDQGTTIPVKFRTKAFDGGVPQYDKYLSSITVEGQTSGQSLSITGYYDRGEESESLGSMATTSAVGQAIVSGAPSVLRHDVALELEGNLNAALVISRVGITFEPQPQRHNFLDSGYVAFEFIQQLKRLELDLDSPENTTITIWADSLQVFQDMLPATVRRQGVSYPLPPGLRGRIWRVTILSVVTTFQCWKIAGFFKQLGTDQAYTERILVQE